MIHDPAALKGKGKGKGQEKDKDRRPKEKPSVADTKPSVALDPEAIKFPDGKLCCFANTRNKCTLGKQCPCGHGKPSVAMLKKRDDYEKKNGREYVGWAEKVKAMFSKGGGKGASEKKPKNKDDLMKDKDGNILPLDKVGCNFLAQGKDCPKGKPDCKFSHDPKDVTLRKKHLAKLGKLSVATPAPKAEAKSDGKKKKKKKKEEEESSGGCASECDYDEDEDDKESDNDQEEDDRISSESDGSDP